MDIPFDKSYHSLFRAQAPEQTCVIKLQDCIPAFLLSQCCFALNNTPLADQAYHAAGSVPALTEAIAHQQYPFDVLVQELTQRHGKLGQLMEYYLVQSSIVKEEMQEYNPVILSRKSAPEPVL